MTTVDSGEQKELLELAAVVMDNPALIRDGLDNLDQGITIFDSQFKLVLFNKRLVELLEFPPDFVHLGIELEEMFRFNAKRGEYGEGDPEALVAERMALARKLEPHCFDRIRPDRTVIEIKGKPLPVGGFVTIYSDVTELRGMVDRLQHMAHFDPLTNLANRRMFMQFLEYLISRTRRSNKFGALVFVDLDRFKSVNDSLGHTVGDAVLVNAAKRIRENLREHEHAARLGGDEFALIVEGLNKPDEARIVAQRVLDSLSEPFDVEGHSIALSASAGIHILDREGDDGVEDLLRKADRAMYRVKKRGNGGVAFFDGRVDVEYLEAEQQD